MPDRRCRRSVAGGIADASDTPGAARPHRAVFRAVRANWKGHLLRRAAADRRDHRNHRKPEGRHGGAGGVLRSGTGPTGAGWGLICSPALAAPRIQSSSSAKADDPVNTGDYWIPASAGMTTSWGTAGGYFNA